MSPSGEPELLQHERLIELFPALLHFPANHTVDDQPVDCYSLPGRRRRPERPGMRAGGCPAERNQIALNELIFHREVQIRECSQEAGDELLPGADSAQWLCIARYVDDAIGPERSVGARHVAAIETLDPTPLVLQ